MKTPPPSQPNSRRRRRTAAFTLVELMVSVGIFLGILTGVLVGIQLFGMRVYTLAATKLTATEDARKTLNILRNQIRSAKLVYVGTYANSVFSRIADGRPQTGNALEIFSADANNTPNVIPVVYYQASSGSKSGIFSVSNDVVNMMANYVTNRYVFTAEDYRAKILTTYDNNPVIRVTLQFYQWEYPISVIGTNGVNAYNFYRLQTRISRRARE
jgi:type II secretory pathway pseudopilin PulG